MSAMKNRVLSAATLLVMVTAGSLALASPAQATFTDCTNYVEKFGYSVGPKVSDACRTSAAAKGNPVTEPIARANCRTMLTVIGVDSTVARVACEHAQR